MRSCSKPWRRPLRTGIPAAGGSLKRSASRSGSGDTTLIRYVRARSSKNPRLQVAGAEAREIVIRRGQAGLLARRGETDLLGRQGKGRLPVAGELDPGRVS